jgi:hypothetical protein
LLEFTYQVRDSLCAAAPQVVTDFLLLGTVNTGNLPTASGVELSK